MEEELCKRVFQRLSGNFESSVRGDCWFWRPRRCCQIGCSIREPHSATIGVSGFTGYMMYAGRIDRMSTAPPPIQADASASGISGTVYTSSTNVLVSDMRARPEPSIMAAHFSRTDGMAKRRGCPPAVRSPVFTTTSQAATLFSISVTTGPPPTMPTTILFTLRPARPPVRP